MFFVLSKILDVAFSPMWWALALFVASAVVGWRRPGARRAAIALLLSGIGVLVFFSFQPISNAIYRLTEQPVETTVKPGEIYDVAIVLGGALNLGATASTGEPQYNDSVERVLAAFELFRAGRVRNVFVSGGDPNPQGRPVDEGAIEAKQLVEWGVPAEHVFSESKSRNTRENATETAVEVAAHGWKTMLLITSATHMRRARDTFRVAGLTVDTLAVDVRSYDPRLRHGSWIPRVDFLNESNAALRELGGRWIYRVRGYAR